MIIYNNNYLFLFTSAFAEVLILRVISLARSLAHACNSKTKVASGPNFSEYSPIDSGDLKERFRP